MLVALGLTIIFGILDIVNFAHGEFYMLGAFAAYYVTNLLGVPYLLGIVAAALVVGLLGALCEQAFLRPLRKLEGHFPGVMITYGLNIVIAGLALIVFGPAPRTIDSPFAHQPVSALGIHTTEQKILVFVIGILFVLCFDLFIRKSRSGRAMRAVALDKVTAALMGINVNRIYYLTFGLGCAVAAMAGAMLGPMLSMDTNMGHMAILKAFVVVILGGMGSVMGALTGGLLLGVLEGLTAAYISTAYKDVFGFGMVILVLLFMPQGIMGLRRRQ